MVPLIAYINIRPIKNTSQYLVFATINEDRSHKKLYKHIIDDGDAIELQAAVNDISHSLNLIGITNITNLTKTIGDKWFKVINDEWKEWCKENIKKDK